VRGDEQRAVEGGDAQSRAQRHALHKSDGVARALDRVEVYCLGEPDTRHSSRLPEDLDGATDLHRHVAHREVAALGGQLGCDAPCVGLQRRGNPFQDGRAVVRAGARQRRRHLHHSGDGGFHARGVRWALGPPDEGGLRGQRSLAHLTA
jgi:hypothetical protein